MVITMFVVNTRFMRENFPKTLMNHKSHSIYKDPERKLTVGIVNAIHLEPCLSIIRLSWVEVQSIKRRLGYSGQHCL